MIEPLDLARALVDLGDLRVAVVALDRELLLVAVAAEDLDRLRLVHGGAPYRRGEELRLRARLGVRLLRLLQPRRAAGIEQARGVDLGRHVGELVLDRPGRRRSAGRTRGASFAYSRATSYAACAMPTACAAIPIRPPSSVAIATWKPLPSSCRSRSVSTCVSTAIELVVEELSPSFSSRPVTRIWSASRMKAEMPREPGVSGSVRAKNRNVPAYSAVEDELLRAQRCASRRPRAPPTCAASRHQNRLRPRSARTRRSARRAQAAARIARAARRCRSAAAAA